MARILVVDDDPEIAGLMKGRLAAVGFEVDIASTARGALTLAMHARHDAIVLDRMLPDLDGLSVLKALRAARVSRPVLLLSALGAVDQRVEGLRAGADDYLAKPFSTEELIARLEVLLRRSDAGTAPAAALACGDLVLDPERIIARRGARVLDLKRRASRSSGSSSNVRAAWSRGRCCSKGSGGPGPRTTTTSSTFTSAASARACTAPARNRSCTRCAGSATC